MSAARRDHSGTGVEYFRADLREWSPPAAVDVLISNATLQWVPGHLHLLLKLAEAITRSGTLAFAVPGNFAEPSHVLLRALAAEESHTGNGRQTSRSRAARIQSLTLTCCPSRGGPSMPGRPRTCMCWTAPIRCSDGYQAPEHDRSCSRFRRLTGSGSRQPTKADSGRCTPSAGMAPCCRSGGYSSSLGANHEVAPRASELSARRGRRCAGFYGAVLGLPEVAKPPVLAARGGVWFRQADVEVGVEEPFIPAAGSRARPLSRAGC